MTEIVVKLSDEDRKLLKAVAAGLAKAEGKAAPAAAAAKGKTKAKAEEEEADDTDGIEDVDGDDAADDAGDDADDAGDDADDFGDDAGDDAGEEPELSSEDVRNALRAYAKASGSQNAAMNLMKKIGGADALSKLKPAKFKAVIDAANKAAKAAAAKAKGKGK